MIHLIYISSATKWPTEDDLKALLEQARTRNLRQSITGLLLYGNATYMQVLEGEEKDVHEIFESIKIDPRNTGVVKLVEEKISQRAYRDWSMGFKDLKSCTPEELPGYSDLFLHGNLDKALAIQNKLVSIRLLLSFADKIAS